jgi:Arc/MetJ-type ribon-helix-helix transcriptional regulator
METELSERSLERIREKVTSGAFETADEVIEQALGLLEDREREYGEWLRAEVAKARRHPNAGDTVPYDDAYKAAMRARLAGKVAARRT